MASGSSAADNSSSSIADYPLSAAVHAQREGRADR
jgi:hypothetical protein